VLFDMAFSAWCLRARTACVSNIEQLPQVGSAIYLWSDGERGLRSRLYNQKTGAVMPSLLSIFYGAKHHKISEQPLDSEILGNLDKTSNHFIPIRERRGVRRAAIGTVLLGWGNTSAIDQTKVLHFVM
jgi:hypothetical protein